SPAPGFSTRSIILSPLRCRCRINIITRHTVESDIGLRRSKLELPNRSKNKSPDEPVSKCSRYLSALAVIVWQEQIPIPEAAMNTKTKSFDAPRPGGAQRHAEIRGGTYDK